MHKRRLVLSIGFCAAGLLSLICRDVRAQDAAGSPSAQAEVTRLVITASGSKYVGIVEPGTDPQQVVLRTVSGKRRFERNEILRIEEVPADPVARAQKLDRIVVLNNGAVYRGELLSWVEQATDGAERGVTLVLATGTVQQIRIDEISRARGINPPVGGGVDNSLPLRVRVQLRDGRVMAGELVEWNPAERLILKLATGELRTATLAEIAELDGRLGQAQALPKVVEQGTRNAKQELDSVQVFLLPQEDITLQLENPFFETRQIDLPGTLIGSIEYTRGRWLAACQPPCGRWLPRDTRYRIRSEKLPEVDPFRLTPAGDQVTLYYRLQKGRRSLRILGGVLLGYGPPAFLAGVTCSLVGSRPFSGTSTMSAQKDVPLLAVGLTLLFTGLGSIVAGGVLLGTNGDRVTLAQQAGPPGAQPDPSAPFAAPATAPAVQPEIMR